MNEIAMNIGAAARAAGVSAKMMRHYEGIGLIPKAKRTAAGYRVYTQRDVHILRFIKQARNLGFSIDAIEQLLALWQNKQRPSREVKTLVERHIQELDQRIAELQSMQLTLSNLAKHCRGDERPECPILQELEKPVKERAMPPRVRSKAKAIIRR